MRKLLVTFVVMLGACTLNEPQDLRFDSLSVVNARNELPLMKLEEKRSDTHPENLKLLKIVLSSTVDLVQFAKNHTYNVSYASYLCDADGKLVSEVFSNGFIGLVIGGKSLGGATYFEKNNLNDFRDADGRISYYVLVPLESEEMHLIYPHLDNGKSKLFNFDKDLLNICIQLKGAKMWIGTSFSSNLVTIPRSAILRGLSEPKEITNHNKP